MIKYAYAGVAFLAMTVPALAQEYYIVREPDSEECTIVETKPAGTEVRILGNTVFASRSEAEAQVEVLCTDTGGAAVIEEDAGAPAVVVE